MIKLRYTATLFLVAVFFHGCCTNTSPTADETANKAAYMKTIEAFTTGNASLLDGVLDDSFVEHNPDPSVPGTGKQHWKNQVVEYRKSFPDMTASVERIVASGDMVWSHFRIKGTNNGPMGPMPATGKAVNVEGIEIMRFKNGKAVERWGVFDVAGMMTQLGMMPGADGQNSGANAKQ